MHIYGKWRSFSHEHLHKSTHAERKETGRVRLGRDLRHNFQLKWSRAEQDYNHCSFLHQLQRQVGELSSHSRSHQALCSKTHRRVRLGNLREACLSRSPLFPGTVERRRWRHWKSLCSPPARMMAQFRPAWLRGPSSAKQVRVRGMEPGGSFPLKPCLK